MLPIDAVRNEIIESVRSNPVTIVIGETGSGKTTRIPQFLYEAGFAERGVIGVTEPRRIAATSVARYVASQLNVSLGEDVGYQIRFDAHARHDTDIKFMTDGILLREFQLDPDIGQYSVIMIDEAHERSMNIDLLLGLLKDLITRNKKLRLVVTSATIDAEKFSRYFNGAPTISVPGTVHPVDVRWVENSIRPRDMPRMIADRVAQIHRHGEDGDILAFMTGRDDINETISEIEQRKLRGLVAIPAHGSLSSQEQDLIFESFPDQRKVVVATNIAETSLTIDGIVYVVDSGLIKQMRFHSDTGIQSLDVVPHSQSGCAQRTGRAGRTRPGICYRMFPKDTYELRSAFTTPEIMRTSLASTVLTMESIGIPNVPDFDFIDPPDRTTFRQAYETLRLLGAINDQDALTDIGKAMAQLPLEPHLARMILEAEEHGCVEEIATVAAFLSTRSVYVRPKDKQFNADLAHRRFYDGSSDALTYLNIWNAYAATNYDRQWCFDNFLHAKRLWEIKNIRTQLLRILKRHRITIESSTDPIAITRSYAFGLAPNLMEHYSRFAYRGVMRPMEDVFIHPSSALFGARQSVLLRGTAKRWIVAHEVVNTSKAYARGCSIVEAEWLPEIAPLVYTYGEWELMYKDEDTGLVQARRPIYRRNNGQSPLGWDHRDFPVEKAAAIQARRAASAEAQGLHLLTFTDMGGRLYARMPDDSAVQCDPVLAYSIHDGDSYYCEISDAYHRLAEPRFRYLPLNDVDIGDLEDDADAEENQEEVSTSDLAARLKAGWNLK